MKKDDKHKTLPGSGKHRTAHGPVMAGRTVRPIDIRAWKYDREHRRRMITMKKLGKIRGKLLSRILEQEVFRFSSKKKVRLKVIK